VGFEVTLGRTEDDGTVIRASGEVDMATAGRLDDVVREHAGRGPLLVDLSGLTFMDSSGVRTLHALITAAIRDGWTLRFARDLRDNVRQVLWMTGMLDAMPFEDAPPP
jgi:anti-sigma B factor antagonist